MDTVPGGIYRLTFLEGAYPNCAGGPYVIDVDWNGTKVSGLSTTPVQVAQVSPGYFGEAWYRVVDTSLVATAGTTTISFVGGDGCGAAFDAVNLLQETTLAP